MMLMLLCLSVQTDMQVYMVREFYKEKDNSEQLIAQLTGLLAAMQSFARSLTALPWGLLSDIIGRKVLPRSEAYGKVNLEECFSNLAKSKKAF